MAVLGRAALAAALTLLATPAFAIFGGAPVAPGAVLAQSVAAILYHDETGAHLCTGTMLAPRLILTAAHCTDGGRDAISVIFSITLSGVQPDRIRKVAAVARAPATPEAKGKQPYQDPDDVAVILLDSAAPVGTGFARLAAKPAAAGQLTAIGYGATSDFRAPDAQGRHQLGFDGLLRTTAIGVTASGPALLVADQSRGSGVCTGDSGGPLFQTGRNLTVAGLLIGVSSPRAVNDNCRGRAWFASIARWTPWIETAAAAFSQKLQP